MLRGSSSTDDFHSVLAPLSLNTALSRGQRLNRISSTPKRQLRQTIASCSGSSNSHHRRPSNLPTPKSIRTRSCLQNEWLQAAQSSPWASQFHSSPLSTSQKRSIRRDSVSSSNSISRATRELNINDQVQTWTRQQSRLAGLDSTFHSLELNQQLTTSERDYIHDGAEEILGSSPCQRREKRGLQLLPFEDQGHSEALEETLSPSTHSAAPHSTISSSLSSPNSSRLYSETYEFEPDRITCSALTPITSDIDNFDFQVETLQGIKKEEEQICLSSPLEMRIRQRSIESPQSPLANKRKASDLTLSASNVKKQKKDKVIIHDENLDKERFLVPEVVVKAGLSPWSHVGIKASPKKRKALQPIASHVGVYVVSDSEDSDFELVASTSAPASSSPHAIEKAGAFSGSSGNSSLTPRHKYALKKMTVLLEAIFEADDEINNRDDDQQQLSKEAQEYFGLEGGKALLRGSVVASIVRTTHRCPSKCNSASDTDKEEASKWSDIESRDLNRLMKIINRGLEHEEGMDPFPRKVIKAEKKNLPSQKKNSTSRATSPRKGGANKNAQDDNDDSLTGAQVQQISNKLNRITYSLTLAEACLVLASKEGSAKDLLCEELILPSIYPIKTALENVVIPIAEACSTASSCTNPLLAGFISMLSNTSDENKRSTDLLSKISRLVGSCLGHIRNILQCVNLVLSETMAFNLSTALLPLFFVLDIAEGQKTAKTAAIASLGAGYTPLKMLRSSAIDILRIIYERKEDQRDFIISTILEGMQSLQDTNKRSRKQHKLSSGKSICSSTALLLQIIQASSTPVAKTKKLTMDAVWEDEEIPEEREIYSDVYEMQLLREGQSLAIRAAEGVARCFLSKINTSTANDASNKSSKTSATSLNTGIASVVDTLIYDLLETLTCPEWPAASLLLSQLCKEFCATLENEKASHEIRGIALDQLALIAKHWFESKEQISSANEEASKMSMIQEKLDENALDELNDKYWRVINHLRQAGQDSTSSLCAARFMEAQWGIEMVSVLHKSVSSIEDLNGGTATVTAFIRHVDTLIGKMVTAAAEADDAMSIVTLKDDGVVSLPILDVYRQVMHTFFYMSQFEIVEMHLMVASNGPSAVNRNKAIRGLANLCSLNRSNNKDEYQNASMLEAAQRCLYDESVQVRDAAVSLLGKMTLNQMDQMESRLPILKEKLEDTGLLVRKRTLRLLKELYDSSKEEANRVELAVEMARCVFDEEETIKDLAVDFMSQIWFDFALQSDCTKTPSKEKKTSPSKKDKGRGKDDLEQDDEGEYTKKNMQQIQTRLKNLVQVADRLRVKPDPVQEILRLLSKKKDADHLSEQMKHLVHATVIDIVDSHQSGNEVRTAELVKQVEVIVLLVQTNPTSLSIAKAKLLLPYLRSGNGEAEVRLLKGLLNIFNSCLPIMPSTAKSLAKQLQTTLTPLCSRPSMHAPVLEELLKCFCIVVRHHTKDMDILIKTLRVCYGQLKNMLRRVQAKEMSIANARVMLLTAAYLVENANFDAMRVEDSLVAVDIDSISKSSISDSVANLLVGMLVEITLRSSALQALRIICRAYPRLLLSESIGDQVEKILKQGTDAEQSLVLQVVSDIMANEATRFDCDLQHRPSRKIPVKVVTREELAGEAKPLANPATFEIVARYGDLIQSLIKVPLLQRQVLDVVEVVIMRGICHPLQYLSTLVALQTMTTNRWVAEKAQCLHRYLITKNNSSINFGHNNHARDAWQLHIHMEGKEARGTNRSMTGGYEAVFETWYNTIRETRKTRIEYLKSLIKAFDIDVSGGKIEEDDVHYARFIADNLATIKYKLTEEVILVLSELQDRLTCAAEQVQVSVQEEVPVDGEEEDDDDDEMEEDGMALNEDASRGIIVGRMSTVMSIVLHLRAHLKILYGLSEGQISRGAENKASNAVASRKREIGMLVLDDVPGALNRKISPMLARREMNYFDTLFDNEKVEADEDDYDADD